jgi:hypothetical protein
MTRRGLIPCNALPVALLGSCLLAVACGVPSVDDAIADQMAAFKFGAYELVVERAPALVQRCNNEGVGEEKAFKVEKFRVLALGKLGKGEEVSEELIRLESAFGDLVTAGFYGRVGGDLTDSGSYLEAITVLDAGIQKFPDKSELFRPIIKRCKKRATSAGDSAAIKRLESFGDL